VSASTDREFRPATPSSPTTDERRGHRAFPTIGRIARPTPRADRRADVSAGLALTAVLVPVGMGYAEAAGLPAVAGLYATIGALVAYFLVGPSRILVFGPDSALLPLFAAAVVPLAAGDPVRAIELASAITVMADPVPGRRPRPAGS
jgi:MFS superfamily sulfate permease-like transporter